MATELTTKLKETVAAGGFRIEIGPDELTVTADRKTKEHSVLYMLVAVLSAPIYIFTLIFGSHGYWPYLLIAVFLIVSPAALRNWRRGQNTLHCTRESLEVINLFRRRIRATTPYRKEEVKRIEFGVVSGSFSDHPSCGLIFTVAGKKVKMLDGLEIIEAQRLLSELKRLGYDTVYDVGMPMAVEMALERRNSIWH